MIDVMKQALEALKGSRVLKADYLTLEGYGQAQYLHNAAITALRQAIEEAEKPPIYVQRATNDYENGWEDGFKAGAQKEKGSTPRNVDPRLLLDSTFNCNTTLQAEKQQALDKKADNARELGLEYEQTHTDHPMRHWDRTCPACVAEVKKEGEWVGLTDEDVQSLEYQYLMSGVEFEGENGYWAVYRAIEAKLRERNT